MRLTRTASSARFGRRSYRHGRGFTSPSPSTRPQAERLPTPWEWKPAPAADSKAALDAMAAALNADQVENARRARLAYMANLEATFPCVRGATLSAAFMSALDDLNWAHLTRRPVAPEHVGRLNERLQAVARVSLTEDEIACATALFQSYE